MELCIKAGAIALIAANASIFCLTKGKPKYGALIASNLITIAVGAAILIVVANARP